MLARTSVAALTILCFTGCTTLQPLADTQPATIRQSVHPGDKVEIVRHDGSPLTLKVESVTDTAITGVAGKSRYEVPMSDIRTIGTRVMTTTDKVWLGVGIAAIVGGIAAASGGGGGGSGGSGY